MNNHTYAAEMTAVEAIEMVLKRPEMYGLQKIAARQPTEDDREARERVSGFCQEWRKLRGNDRESIYNLHLGTDREVELRTTDLERLARAAVPDAATELERERKLGAARQRFVFETGQHNERLLSERDAALAAIERVAEEIEAVAGGITSSSEAAGYRNGLLRAAQIVRTALDGAPEPEVKP